MKNIHLGFSAMNIKTNRFVDFEGRESKNCFNTWSSVISANEVLTELEFVSKKFNNAKSRKIKRNLKNYRIVKLTIKPEIV